jgi:hypothetical protein
MRFRTYPTLILLIPVPRRAVFPGGVLSENVLRIELGRAGT